MKNTIKLLFLGLFLFLITAAKAQISTSSGGTVSANVPATNTNVGIGTTSPTNALTVQKVSGGSGVSGTDGTGGVRVKWSSGYGVALDAWDGNEPRWGITSFSGNTPTVILEGKYSSKDAYFNSGGNVGIGTTTPTEKLVVRGDGARIKIETSSNPANYNAYLESKYDANNPFNIVNQGSQIFGTKNIGVGNTPDTYVSGYYGLAFATQTTTVENANVRMYLNQAGNLGIGTINPGYKLDIHTPATATEAYSGINLQSENFGYLIEGGLKQNAGGILKFSLNTAGVKSEKFRMDQNGNVGIGTTAPDHKLTVNGTIHAKEIIVDTAIFPDYVFQKYYTGKSELKSDYAMPTLAEIESFTKKNHHLPNVPSAQEIQENGVSLGEMSNVLLQKIEELTLYVIEQDKKAALQQQELDRLKTENENYISLAERLSAIEKALNK